MNKKSDKVMVSIIIPVYNDVKLYKKHFILEFLDSFDKNKPNYNFELILVDDHSPDKSYQNDIYKKYKHLNITLLENDKNLGFQKTVNKGLKISKGVYAIIGNQDMQITPTSIDHLVDFMIQNDDVAVCGPKMVFSEGDIFDSYRKFPHILDYLIKRTSLYRSAIFKKRMKKYLMWDKDIDKTEEVDWLVFSWAIVDNQVLQECGYLDERFIHFNGDTDLCMTMKKAGYKVVYHAGSSVINSKKRLSSGGLGSIFTNKFVRIHLIDAIKFFLKWGYV